MCAQSHYDSSVFGFKPPSDMSEGAHAIDKSAVIPLDITAILPQSGEIAAKPTRNLSQTNKYCQVLIPNKVGCCLSLSNWERQMAAHLESGSVPGFPLLKGGFSSPMSH